MRFFIGAVCIGCIGTGYLLGVGSKHPSPLRSDAPPTSNASSALVDSPTVAPVAPLVLAPALPVRVALNEPRRTPDVAPEPARLEATSGIDAGQVMLASAEVPAGTPVLAEAVPAAAPSPQEQALANQVGELRAQVQQVEANQQQVDQNAQQRLANQSAAMGALQQADSNLASGDTDIDDDLSKAESLVTGPVVAEIDSARNALQNDDLYFARSHVERALLMVGVPGGRGVVAPSP
jgi:hypothetical protein